MKENLEKEVLYFISLIRESHPYMVDIYTKGSCLNFHLILRDRFRGQCPVPYYNIDHIITKIGDKFYDIEGLVPAQVSAGYAPYNSFYPKKNFISSFKQMYRAFWKPKQN